MKELFRINETTENKISYLLLSVFVMSLPFDRFYSELFLTCFLIHTLIYIDKERLYKINRYTLILSSLYFLALIGVSYTSNRSEGFKSLEIQLAFLLFPFLLKITHLDLNKYKASIVKLFTISCTITIIYLFTYNILIIYKSNLDLTALFTLDFINHNFSDPIPIHATYLSMYTTLSLACCIYFFSESTKTLHRVIYVLMILILFAGTIQLSSRSVTIALVIIVSFLIPKFLLRKKYKWHFICGLIIFLSSLTIISTRLGDLGERNITDLKKDLNNSFAGNIAVEPRMARWGCAWELIKESPVIGHGSGSEIPKLKEKYFEKKYYISYINDLNAHNQYLSLLISFGIIGLFSYLYILFSGVKSSLKNKDFIFASFLVLIAIVSLSENILSVNKGIFFVGFFLPFFFYSNQPDKQSMVKEI